MRESIFSKHGSSNIISSLNIFPVHIGATIFNLIWFICAALFMKYQLFKALLNLWWSCNYELQQLYDKTINTIMWSVLGDKRKLEAI